MTTKDLLIVGGGSHLRSCLEVISSCSDQLGRIGGIVSPHAPDNKHSIPWIGSDNDLPELIKLYPRYFVGMANPDLMGRRWELTEALKTLGGKARSFVASTAVVSDRATIGPGTIVMHGAIVNCDAVIGENCVVNTGAVVEHDVTIGDGVILAPRSLLLGGCILGHRVFVGAGALVKQATRISNDRFVKMGSRVVDDY